ncbi:MAG TPA: response regulator transcription factor [Herpetosiphonaceae bacterium]|nr:response regulator transcription factor [Herpetosiphonaceae bacterium]
MIQRILVVDDEPAVTDLLAYNLRKAHYEVLVAADGRQALALARQETPDLILLDLMLPQIDGLDVCRELRRTSQVPIIILTARDDEIDRVVGLELGADDYVCKPFSIRELLARIKVVLRRVQPAPAPSVANLLAGPGGLRLDSERRTASVAGAALDLSRLEFDLLALLIGQTGRVFTREQLVEQVWGYEYFGDTRVVDSVVKRLRSKLRALDPQADCLAAVRGIGYKAAQEEAP